MENFRLLNTDTFKETVLSQMDNIKKSVNDLLSIKDKTYANFLIPYNLLFEDYGLNIFTLSHIKSSCTNDDIDELYNEMLPLISDFSTEFKQRDDIYEAFKYIKENDTLDTSQERYLDKVLLSFKLSGIGLNDDDKKRIGHINSRLSELSSNFSNKILNDTKDFKLVVDNKDDVLEFDDSELERHYDKEKGNWIFTLQYPSFSAYMKYGNNRSLREKLYKAYVNRGKGNDLLIDEMLSLKHEKANILGYNNYAEISLLTKMANTPTDVINFLDNLSSDEIIDMANSENSELLEFAKLNGFEGEELRPYDIAYFNNKYELEKFNYDENEVKVYFEQGSVLNGLFKFLNNTFDLEFRQVEDPNIWHDKVYVYDVYRSDNYHSRVYIDLEARTNKRQGAWMNNSHTGYKYNGDVKYPIAYITCNFTPSTDDLPSLLKHSEVHTLFHEMGHVLQHICSEVSDPLLSGINGVEWDAVEWASQFLELFTYNKDVISNISRHYETGESMPKDIINKIINKKNHRFANNLLRQVEFGKFDMMIHTTESPNVKETLTEIRTQLSRTFEEYDNFQNAFGHIFGGGYSAGYYSYKWSEVLSEDSYNEFIKRGINDGNNAIEFYNKFLAMGSSVPSMDMFKDYMKREPNPGILLESIK